MTSWSGVSMEAREKGQIAAHLAAEYSLLMRVGGPNAGHSVYLDPKPYPHHQLPSGTRFNSDAQLLIGPGAVLNVEMLLQEIAECSVTADRLRIDPEAMIINDDDIEAEKGKGGLTETIGSTGSGTGIATARRVLRGHPVVGSKKAVRKAKDVGVLRPYLAPHGALSILEDAYRAGDRIFLEGTQGTGLSVIHGEYPHVTSRDTTVSGWPLRGGHRSQPSAQGRDGLPDVPNPRSGSRRFDLRAQ